jgi:hypothetical protein
MPIVTVSKEIPSANRNDVWRAVVDIANYSKFMPQILVIDVLEQRHVDGVVERRSAWTVLFNGNELRWVQQERIQESRGEVQFEQIEGDLATWRGCTRVGVGPTGTTVGYQIEFDLGVPALAGLLHPLAERAVRSNCEQMLAALATRLDTGESACAGST